MVVLPVPGAPVNRKFRFNIWGNVSRREKSEHWAEAEIVEVTYRNTITVRAFEKHRG